MHRSYFLHLCVLLSLALPPGALSSRSSLREALSWFTNNSRYEPSAGVSSPRAAAADPLVLTLQFLNQLYNNNSLAAIDAFCDDNFIYQGCGVWLPNAPFTGPSWYKNINSDLFQSYSSWKIDFLESAATQAVKSIATVFVFFHWTATNTGEFHGLLPSGRVTSAYGIAQFQVDVKSSRSTLATTFRQGFLEEREVKLKDSDPHTDLSAYWDITHQPFWYPSPSLQKKMLAVADKYIQLFNKGPDGANGIDDIAMPWVSYIDGLDIWAPKPLQGAGHVKAGLRAWLQQYSAVATASEAVATPDSNKVFQPFEMQVVHRASNVSSVIRGINLLVFNSWGWLTYIVPFRNGALEEQLEQFIGAAVLPMN